VSDFHQGGPVCTLQRLRDRPAGELADEITRQDAPARIAVILPCHARDLHRPALARILRHLGGAHYISEVILSVNGASSSPNAIADLPGTGRTRVLWNDSQHLLRLLGESGIAAAARPGKGLNVWLAIGDIVARLSADVVVVHDADIENYNPEMLARLTYPVACNELGYKFAKGYYHRAADRLYGRLTRLFFIPLLEAVIHVAGHLPLFDFLSAFRYPLSGEFSATCELLSSVSIAPGYGLETQLLCEMFRTAGENESCQVDIGPNYEHRHHPLADERGGGLQGMCGEIATTLLHAAEVEGVRVDERFLEAVRTAYGNAARESLRRYSHVARMNGFEDISGEESAAVSLFADALETVLNGQRPPPLLPAWNTLHATVPDLAGRILDGRAR
jgi:glucosyl-3-phosphoglycerate synthase